MKTTGPCWNNFVRLGFLAACLFPFALLAQDASEAARSAALPAALPPDAVASFISGAASNHPWLTTLAAVIGFLRLVFKPIVSAAHSFVAATDTEEDDRSLEVIERSKAFKVFAYLLDYTASIKLTRGTGATATRLLSLSLLILLLAPCFTGCASFSTRIEEFNQDGSSRVTVINSRTLFDSKSELAKLRTSHTDKTQSVSLGSITQESSGSNVVNLVEAAVGAAVKAAISK